MAETERISEADRLEQASLERSVSDVERLMLSSSPGAHPILSAFLLNAKARLGALEKKIHDEEHEKEEQARHDIALVVLAEREAALSEKERDQYSGFLKEDFFTKKDFARLDDFYAHGWDRLSQRGRDEMSHRIWEGVRRDEYKFADLPKSVREKETNQAYQILRDSPNRSDSAAQIPEKDKDDFLRAYASGSRDDAAKILDRPSFKENMFPAGDAKEVRHTAVTQGKDVDSETVATGVKAVDPKRGKDQSKAADDSMGNLDLSAIDLSGMKPAENSTQGSVASLPKTQGGAARLRNGHGQWEFTWVPKLQPVGKEHRLHTGGVGVIAMGDGIDDVVFVRTANPEK